jgi:hypothetical protein
MPLVAKDRVRETTTTTGTGAVTLTGPVLGYQAFSVLGNGNTTYYCIANPSTSEWEVGLGTYTASTNTLARTTVFSSSNGGTAVPFSAGAKDIFTVAPPADRFVDNQGNFATGTWNISISGNAATAGSVAGVISVANGGTGATTLTGVVKGNGTSAFTAGNVSLTTEVTGTLPVANGGTGITSFGTGVATALGQNVTGSGGIVLTTSPVLTTPNIGTPSAGTLTSCTGLPIDAGTTGTLPAGRGGTGLTSLGTGVATALGVNTGTAGAFVVNGGALGTPSSGTLTSCTGLPIDGGTTGTLPAGRGGTGLTSLGTGVATFLGTPSSANLRTAVTDETGSGSLVFATSPTLVTPTLGAATATSINSLVLNRGTGSGTEGVAVGSTALDSQTNNGEKNVAVGFAAGTQITDGKESVAIGHTAARDLTTGKGIYIGFESQASSGNVDKEIVVGNQITGKGNNTAFIGGSSGAYNEGNTTTWTTTSDQRIKKNIVDNGDGLEKIKAIRVRNFEYRATEEVTDLPPSAAVFKPGVQLGIIAQEMLPECVRQQSNGVLSVDTDKLIGYLINAVKELNSRIEQLEIKNV